MTKPTSAEVALAYITAFGDQDMNTAARYIDPENHFRKPRRGAYRFCRLPRGRGPIRPNTIAARGDCCSR